MSNLTNGLPVMIEAGRYKGEIGIVVNAQDLNNIIVNVEFVDENVVYDKKDLKGIFE